MPFGSPRYDFSLTDSSNSRVLELARQGAPEGTLVVAETQSSGRGRWGRAWEGAAGKSLLFSLLLRPGEGELSQLSAVFGVALAEACGMGELKWPNDLLFSGRKAAGVLIEGNKDALVLGIGLNVNQLAADFPEELRATATSLRMELGRELGREEVLARVLASCEKRYQMWRQGAFQEIRDAWTKRASYLGQRVRAGKVEGTLIGLNEDGSLAIQGSEGIEKLVSGEVFGLRPILD
jgi:BirA family biotin operon repressor/biotin-[acetyl-CoA-carboxylase] ligase